MQPERPSIWSHDSNETASGKPGTLQVSSIPFIGVILGPLVGPLLAAFMITSGAMADMRNSSIEKQIELFGAKLDAAMARA